jgi:hypothetical protein
MIGCIDTFLLGFTWLMYRLIVRGAASCSPFPLLLLISRYSSQYIFPVYPFPAKTAEQRIVEVFVKKMETLLNFFKCSFIHIGIQAVSQNPICACKR